MRRLQLGSYKKLMPLKRLAEAGFYNLGYISILVQRKKLKAKKIGNKYYSTKEWFNRYLELHARHKGLSADAARELWFGETSAAPASASGEKKLAEILNDKIASPEAGLVADFVEPEVRLKIKWQKNLNQEAKDLLKQPGDAANKIKTQVRKRIQTALKLFRFSESLPDRQVRHDKNEVIS